MDLIRLHAHVDTLPNPPEDTTKSRAAWSLGVEQEMFDIIKEIDGGAMQRILDKPTPGKIKNCKLLEVYWTWVWKELGRRTRERGMFFSKAQIRQKYKSRKTDPVAKKHLKATSDLNVRRALAEDRREVSLVKKYRSGTGGGPPVSDAPLPDPNIVILSQENNNRFGLLEAGDFFARAPAPHGSDAGSNLRSTPQADDDISPASQQPLPGSINPQISSQAPEASFTASQGLSPSALPATSNGAEDNSLQGIELDAWSSLLPLSLTFHEEAALPSPPGQQMETPPVSYPSTHPLAQDDSPMEGTSGLAPGRMKAPKRKMASSGQSRKQKITKKTIRARASDVFDEIDDVSDSMSLRERIDRRRLEREEQELESARQETERIREQRAQAMECHKLKIEEERKRAEEEIKKREHNEKVRNVDYEIQMKKLERENVELELLKIKLTKEKEVICIITIDNKFNAFSSHHLWVHLKRFEKFCPWQIF